MRRDTQAVLLLLVGATLLKVALTGTYVRYVKPGQLPLLLIGGAVLVVVALVTLWRQIQASARAVQVPRQEDPERSGLYGSTTGGPISGSASRAANYLAARHSDSAPAGAAQLEASHPDAKHRDRAEAAARAAAAHEGGGGEGFDDVEASDGADAEAEEPTGHAHDRSRVGWLLLIPALALLLFSPPALGSFQASRNGTALSTASGSDFAPLPPGDPVAVPLLDYAARAVYDQGRSLTGRQVKLTGFVIAGARGEPYLARLVVGCCAADARPIKVGLTGDLPGILAPDQWLEVVGTYTDEFDRDPVNGETIPYLQVVAVRGIDAPAEPYET